LLSEDPEIIVLRAIIKKEIRKRKKKEIDASKIGYIALPASLLSGLKYKKRLDPYLA